MSKKNILENTELSVANDEEFAEEMEEIIGQMEEGMEFFSNLPPELREEAKRELMNEVGDDELAQKLLSLMFSSITVGIAKTPAGYAIAYLEDEDIGNLSYLPDELFENITDEQKQELVEFFIEKMEFPPMLKVEINHDKVREVFEQIARNEYLVDPDFLEDTDATEFEISVWKELLTIPFGETISYSELAERIGNPKATRAVANAVGANTIPWVVPCHRVIEKSGEIGGYAYGIERKQKLLDFEKANRPTEAATV